MEFQRVNRSDPERIFMVVRNSYSTAAFTNGQWCGWDIATDQDGVNITKITATVRCAPAGCVVQNIPVGDYGLIQIWGYKADARCLGGCGSVTSKLTVGRPMYFDTSRFCPRAMERTSVPLKLDHGKFPAGICIAPKNTAGKTTSFATSAQYKVLVRCL